MFVRISIDVKLCYGSDFSASITNVCASNPLESYQIVTNVGNESMWKIYESYHYHTPILYRNLFLQIKVIRIIYNTLKSHRKLNWKNSLGF